MFSSLEGRNCEAATKERSYLHNTLVDAVEPEAIDRPIFGLESKSNLSEKTHQAQKCVHTMRLKIVIISLWTDEDFGEHALLPALELWGADVGD